jgi:hypothetical protein
MQLRVGIDVTPGMLDRSRAEVAMRLATSIEAEHNVIRAQDALLRLIYGIRFTEFAETEILTSTLPLRQAGSVLPAPHIELALQNRSEIHQAIRQIKASSVRLQVAQNAIQPVLDMVLTGYAAGLEGNNDVGKSFQNQFRQGEPGVGIGFNFEVPYRNRAAQAAADQAHIAIHRMQSEFEATIGLVTEDVRYQVIQRNKHSAMLPQYWDALMRADRILKHTQLRRQNLTDGIEVADLYLENLLQMQARLAAAEYTFLQSQIQCSLANSSLQRAVSALHLPTMPGSSRVVTAPSVTTVQAPGVTSAVSESRLLEKN